MNPQTGNTTTEQAEKLLFNAAQYKKEPCMRFRRECRTCGADLSEEQCGCADRRATYAQDE